MTETPSAVRFFAIDHPSLPRTLRIKLEQRLLELRGLIECAQNWDDFRWRQGQIFGLREAVDICEQLEKEMRN